MPLTDNAVKSARCPAGKPRARFTDAKGLYLEVSPTGNRRWFLKYRIGKTEKRLALGSYPAVWLAKARTRRDEARLDISRGADPALERQTQKLRQKLPTDDRLAAVGREWLALRTSSCQGRARR